MAAQLQRTNGEILSRSITLGRGDVLALKINRVDKRIGLRFHSTDPTVMVVQDAVYDARSSSWQFKLIGKANGSAALQTIATVPAGITFAAPLQVQVKVELIPECKKFKTLCDALRELAAIEMQKGSAKFIRDILDRDKLLQGELSISHNGIVGGGDPHNKSIEDTEFRDSRSPAQVQFYVDIEYVEAGYAMARQQMRPEAFHLVWNLSKVINSMWESINGRMRSSDIGWGTGPNHPPNINGLRIGKLIAERYRDISHFATEYCKDECK